MNRMNLNGRNGPSLLLQGKGNQLWFTAARVGAKKKTSGNRLSDSRFPMEIEYKMVDFHWGIFFFFNPKLGTNFNRQVKRGIFITYCFKYIDVKSHDGYNNELKFPILCIKLSTMLKLNCKSQIK